MLLSTIAFVAGFLLWNFFSLDQKFWFIKNIDQNKISINLKKYVIQNNDPFAKDLKSCKDRAIFSDDTGMLDREQFMSTGRKIVFMSCICFLFGLGKVSLFRNLGPPISND